MSTASINAAQLHALLESGGAPAHVETLFRNTVEHAPIGIAFANRDGSLSSLQSRLLRHARLR